MEKIQVNLLSCRTREMNTDLLPIYRKLQSNPDCYVHTYVKNRDQLTLDGNHSNTIMSSSSFQKNIFLCNDIGLRQLLRPLEDSSSQMLLITPNNPYYQLALKSFIKRQEKLALAKFSHIFAPNPFIMETIKKHYILNEKQKLILMETPFSFRLRDEELQQSIRRQFTLRFPKTADKKILFIMLPKQMSKETQKSLEKFSLPDFLDKLGKDWFLITNSLPILKQSGSDCSDRSLYISLQYPLDQILYFSDMLITDMSFFAHGQLIRKKPFFCLSYQNNGFEQYMKKHFPALFLSSLYDLFYKWNGKETALCLDEKTKTAAFTTAFEKIHHETTYYQESDPVDQITNLIFE